MDYYKSLGLDFVCFTEHASNPGQPEVLDLNSDICQSLLQEIKQINEANENKNKEIIALSGVETSILFNDNGEPVLDTPEEVLQQLDIVVASRHQIDDEKNPQAIKKSLLFAAQNSNVDVLGHPDRYTRKNNEKNPEYWAEYWSIWPDILQTMKDNNKAFEINLNNQPAEKLVKMAVDIGLRFLINYDAHDFNQYKKEESVLTNTGESLKKKWAKDQASKADMELLKEYKTKRLTSGPGTKAIIILVKWLKKLESWGVTPESVINSSKENLISFLKK